MQIATMGLVLRQVKVGEADQILTILTPELGVVSASARGSLRLKSRLFSGCGLFCYSEFSITTGRKNNFIETAEVEKVFHGLGSSVEAMALATYLAEITITLSPTPPEAGAVQRLLLNCYYMLSEGKRPPQQIKTIYEMRVLSLTGYLPDLLACAGCGRYDGGDFYFDTQSATLLCAQCAEKERHVPNLDAGALYALRHICLAEDKKLFAFSLSAASQKNLGRVGEQYLLQHMEYGLKSLDFLKAVLD